MGIASVIHNTTTAAITAASRWAVRLSASDSMFVDQTSTNRSGASTKPTRPLHCSKRCSRSDIVAFKVIAQADVGPHRFETIGVYDLSSLGARRTMIVIVIVVEGQDQCGNRRAEQRQRADIQTA